MMNNLSPPKPSLFAKLVSLIIAATAVTLVFMFSLVLIPVLLLLGTGLWFYLRWKMKQWQQTMAAQMAEGKGATWTAGGNGEVIEGEAVVVREGNEVLLAQEVLVRSATTGNSDQAGNSPV